jgi:CubicO group peptidase (beta-lactamase class C family)
MTRAGLDGVRASVQTHIDSNQLSGAVTAIARHNKLVWFEAQGVRNTQTADPMRRDDIFRLASSTKPVVAASILILMDEGKLSIDDKVSRFIPTFANPKVAVAPEGAEKALFNPALRAELKAQVKLVPADREITLKDLLTHTAGLGTIFGLGDSPQIKADQTLADRVPLIGNMPLDFQPGAKWSYSAVDGFDVLLRVVEIVSGLPGDEFMRRRIFEPLEMTDTGFHVSADKRERVVYLSKRQNNAWTAGDDMLGSGDPAMRYLSGAGGLLSTARDYMQFQAMLLNRGELNGRRILKPETVALMSTNHVGSLFEQFTLFQRKGCGFGLGVGIVLDTVASGTGRGRGSFGWDGAYGTDGWVDPENDLAAVYFVQQNVRPTLLAFGTAIREAIAT